MRPVRKLRAKGKAARLAALLVLVAVAASAALSVPSSAKVIETIFNNTPLNPAASKAAAAAVPAAQTQAQGQQRADAEEEEEEGADDADVPRFMAGKIDKEEYLRRREEHINRLRGVERGKPFDPGARGRAIRQLERQSGRPDKTTATNENFATTNSAAADSPTMSGATVSATTTLSAQSLPTWTSVGPAPIPNGQTFSVQQAVSGRVTAIAIHPSNSNIAYVGTAQGGVYRTTDGGQTWTAIFDNAQTLAVGSIAIAPSQPSTIYVGTGEGNFGCDTFFGVGVYRIDNADSASPVMSGPFNQETSTGADVLTGRSISKVLVHPTDPNTIFLAVNSGGIGGIGCDVNPTQASARGVYRSTNATSANATFQKLNTATANSGNRSATDLEFEPGNPNVLWASIVGFSTANDGGVYRSTNALAATPIFSQVLSAGTTSATARVELAVNKVGTTVTAYAGISDGSGTLKRTTNNGGTWTTLTAANGYCGGQCFYDMPIAVDPNNAAVLYIGGSADGTSSAIIKKSTNATGTASFTKVQNGLHADSHAIEIDPQNANNIWFGSDGGVWKSTDAAATWNSLNNAGFNATQFQSVARHPIDANYSIGGTQDNGTERMRADGTWTRTDYGDGGFALIDQNATNTTTVRQYHTYYNQVGTGGIVGLATTTSSTAFENWTFLGCGGTSNGLSCNDSAVEFYAPMALGPGNPNTLYFGTDRLYRSANNGTTMTAVSQQFVSGVAVSVIGISPQNDAVRIVGLSNGKVYRTTTGANPMADVTGAIPAKYVSRVVVDPNNQNTAYVTLAGFFGNSTTAHVYKTTDLNSAAPTWTGLDAGQIPDVPVDAFAVDPADSNMLYAGTDIGVYRSADGGATWEPFSNGLPRVAVFDMAIHQPSRTLRIATHGRGLWDISIAAPVAPGTLQGTVRDSNNNAIGGATVNAGSNTTTADASGFYSFAEIAPGSYGVTASAQGFNSSTAQGVTVTSGATTTQDFSLSAAPAHACLTDTTQADFQTGAGTSVDLTASPGDVQLANSGSTALDQQQTSFSFFVSPINPTAWMAQTFVPASSGRLSSVDVQLATATTGTAGPLVVEIHNTVGGAPGSTVLASVTTSDVTSATNAWVPITFASPANVTAGTTYAIVLRGATGGDYRATRSNKNSYSGGAWYTSTNSGSTWAAQGQDLAFRTYVTPVSYAASGTLVSSSKDSNPAVGVSTNWTTLTWTAAAPAGTSVKFQVAASNSASGPFNFVGPDGTAATYFTASGSSLGQFNGFRYLKYKAYLATTGAASTPTLSDVTLCY
ncbi:MAG TPA: carboxypeptidase regulatory-like domain-containing protein [Pyrinomonadaceae bacterium]|nr:carboxypeptidase regulatory-like domain-containing protein [Pyrinomonadaceae bacterium]